MTNKARTFTFTACQYDFKDRIITFVSSYLDLFVIQLDQTFLKALDTNEQTSLMCGLYLCRTQVEIFSSCFMCQKQIFLKKFEAVHEIFFFALKQIIIFFKITFQDSQRHFT